MKSTFLAFFLLVSMLTLAQGNIIYHLKVQGPNGDGLSNIQVIAVESKTLAEVKGKTDVSGKLTLNMDNGKEWLLSVGELKNTIQVKAVDYSIAEIGKTYIYDVEAFLRKKTQILDRSQISFLEKKQLVSAKDVVLESECMVIVKVATPEGKPLNNISVSVINLEDKIKYTAKSDINGKAVFKVPNQSKYDIDIESFLNYTYCDFGKGSVRRTIDAEFVPMTINEEVVNDTVYHKANQYTKPTSSRALIKLTITGGKRKGINEPVFLRQLNSSKVYAVTTNSLGIAYVLLPIKEVFMVDFNYQKSVDVVNLTYKTGLVKGEYSIYYNPDPRLEYPEKFIPTSDRLFVEDFNSFLKEQFVKPTDRPFNIKVKSMLKINKNSKEALFEMTLATSSNYGKGNRMPLHLVLVLDKSGSMYGNNRGESLKLALWEIGSSLEEGDVVSIVFFDMGISAYYTINKDYLAVFEKIIEMYMPGGGTNIFGGLKKGVELIKNNIDDSRANKIILLTDGYGTSETKNITDFIELESKEGIDFSAVGVGEGFNESLLRLIAQKGNGTYYRAGEAEEISNVFADAVNNSFSYVAKDLKIEIFYHKKMIYSKLYGYPLKEVKDNQLSININKLPCNKNEISFIKFLLDKADKTIEDEPLKIKVSYFDPTKLKQIEYEEEIPLMWSDESELEWNVGNEEKRLYAIAILNQSLKVMAEAHGNNNTKDAIKALKSGIQQLKEIFPEAKPKKVKALFEEVNKYLLLLQRIDSGK